jgi:hypothetical protein
MRLAWATSLLMLTTACRAPSSDAEAWRTPRPAWRVEGVEPRTVATGDGVAAFATDHAKGLVAVDLRTGRKRWEIAAPDLVPESLVIAGGALLMSQQTGKVSSVALADGSRRWSMAVGCSFIAPEVQQDLIIGACDSLTEHPLRHGIAALDVRTSAVKARVDSPDGSTGTAGIDTRALYMVRGDWPSGVVIAVDRASGREMWRRTLPQGVRAARVVDDVLVVQGDEVFGLRPTDGAGTAPWRGPDECETDDYEVVGTGSLERIQSDIFGHVVGPSRAAPLLAGRERDRVACSSRRRRGRAGPGDEPCATRRARQPAQTPCAAGLRGVLWRLARRRRSSVRTSEG